MKKWLNYLPTIFILSIVLSLVFYSSQGSTVQMNYTQFEKIVDEVDFKKSSMTISSTVIQLEGTYEQNSKTIGYKVIVPRTEKNIEKLEKDLQRNGGKLTVEDPNQGSVWISILSQIIPFLIIAVFFYFMFSKMGGGGNNKAFEFAKSKARVESNVKVRFKDVAGCEEEKEEVKEIEVQEPADTTEETNELYAPMKGEVLDVAKSADPAFASKAMGEGVAINPSEGIVYAPADGTISLIFPTKHAMGITLNSGVELLIHAGIDTVKMNGEGFETFVETGAKVKKGDKLLSFDMDLVKEKGYKTQTMFLVADAKGNEVEVVETADADNNTKIMNLK